MRATSRGSVFVNVPGVEFVERPLDGERCADSPFGVVLLRLRIPEQDHESVAKPILHTAA